MEKSNSQRNRIHKVLAHSYVVYFVFFLIGIYLDFVFKIQISNNTQLTSVGLVFVILGTLLTVWAQTTSHKLNKENLRKETFCRGPYRYTRCPTHWGLLFLLLGVGMTLNTFFVLFLSFVAFLVSKFTFLNKQEKLLEEKYGTAYREYKEAVKF